MALDDPSADLGIAHAVQGHRHAPFARPGREVRYERPAASQPRRDVEANFEPAVARLLQHLDARACLAPVLLTSRVHVGHDQRHPGALGDLDRLGDRLLQVPAVVPDVGVVGPAVRRERLGHLDDLVRVREDGVLVHQPGAEAPRAVGERGGHQLPHLRAFVGSRRTVGLPHDDVPDVQVPGHGDDVARRPGVPDGVPVLAHRLPRPVVAVYFVDGGAGAVVVDHVHLHGRGGVAAVADDERRHALPDARLGQRVDQDRNVRVAVLLDEAGRDEVSGGVDRLRGFPIAEPSHRDDPVAHDRDVGSEPGAAGAVEHAAVLDQQVVHVCLRLRRFALGYIKIGDFTRPSDGS